MSKMNEQDPPKKGKNFFSDLKKGVEKFAQKTGDGFKKAAENYGNFVKDVQDKTKKKLADMKIGRDNILRMNKEKRKDKERARYKETPAYEMQAQMQEKMKELEALKAEIRELRVGQVEIKEVLIKEIRKISEISESFEMFADKYLEDKDYVKAYENYNKSLATFQQILNSKKDESFKQECGDVYERLPSVLKKIDEFLEKRSFELSSNEINKISKNAVNICKQVQEEDIYDVISEECLKIVKKLNLTKDEDAQLRERITKEWHDLLTEQGFLKLEKETRENLIRYKFNKLKIPDDYESFIRRIAIAVESEVKVKLFDGFRQYWKTQVASPFPGINTKINNYFKKNYNILKGFVEDNKFSGLKAMYFVLRTVNDVNKHKDVPSEYQQPFEAFRDFISREKMKYLGNVVKFFSKKYSCGEQKHFFIDIRNTCSHGGGKTQEGSKINDFQVDEVTIEQIEKNLIGNDIKLLESFYTLES